MVNFVITSKSGSFSERRVSKQPGLKEESLGIVVRFLNPKSLGCHSILKSFMGDWCGEWCSPLPGLNLTWFYGIPKEPKWLAGTSAGTWVVL